MNKVIISALFLVFTLQLSFATSFEEKSHDVSTVTNCLTDRFFKVPRHFLTELLSTDTGGLIDGTKADRLYSLANSSGYKEIHNEAGGSTGNSAVALKNLGFTVCLLGTLANDELGMQYKQSLEKHSIDYSTATCPPEMNALKSGTCTIFISENDTGELERAMFANLGVSGYIDLSAKDIEMAAQARCFLAEGYSFNTSTPITRESVLKVAAAAKEKGNLVALTLSADFCVTYFAEGINAFIDEYASIVIGNESEARILTANPDNTLEAVKALQARKKKGAITCGSAGAYVYDETGIYFISCPNVDLEKVVDPTGAGDVFAAGLIYGMLSGKSIFEAGQIAALCAGEVIKVYGGHVPDSLSEMISSGVASSITYAKIDF